MTKPVYKIEVAVTSLLGSNASSGQKDVEVKDATKFSATNAVTIADNNKSENNTVASIDGNTLTMENNLANNYTVAAHGHVAKLIHTITDTVRNIHVKEVVTDSVGTFSFSVPTKLGSSYKYDDVKIGDQVKIWLDYNSVPANPLTIGKIYHISGPLSIETGYIRVFSGKNQGEVLQRRFKTKYWESVGASTIVTELATDLGLGTGDIQADATSVTLKAEDKRYWDILKEISDYWYSAESQISKDFYVDIDNDLVWKDRPFRTSGVETLTIGDNIVSYNVTRDLTHIYNQITAYGARECGFPQSKDQYTEQDDSETVTADGWIAISPANLSIAWNSGYKMVGNESFSAYSPTLGTPIHAIFRWAHGSALDCSRTFKTSYDKVRFWILSRHSGSGNPTSFEVRIYAPNASNYFYKVVDPLPVHNQWVHYDWEVGPDSGWEITGSPDWTTVYSVCFTMYWPAGAATLFVDGMYFNRACYRTVNDSTSQSAYGIKQLVAIDEDLRTYDECESRAEALLDKYKAPVEQIEVVTRGNTNILIGDQLTMTMLAENISSQNFYVFSVDHFLDASQGFLTTAVMNSNIKQKEKSPTSQRDITVQLGRQMRQAYDESHQVY